MNYIAVLSYEQLDNGLFLTSFARTLAQKKKRGIILHEASEYTERIIQTGVMREEATVRCIKELNHRLVALLADEGISTIALNGFQKKMIRLDENKFGIDFTILDKLPPEPVILISTLATNEQEDRVEPISISAVAEAFRMNYSLPYIELFSINQNSDMIDQNLPQIITPSDREIDFLEQNIPSSFRSYDQEVRLQSPLTF